MRGKIYAPEAYAQSKPKDAPFLCHGGWQEGPGPLPRGITPSDVDAYWHDKENKTMIYGEFSSQHDQWCDLNEGQILGYQGHIQNDRLLYIAALLFHAVPSHRIINSMRDVESFQIMLWIPKGGWIRTSRVYPWYEWLWESFVKDAWYKQPAETYKRLLDERRR